MSLHTAPRQHPLLSLEVDTPSWDGAACVGHDPEMWFADQQESRRAYGPEAAQHRLATAKRICWSCPVRSMCRSYAETRNEWGVWGGRDTRQRLGQGKRLGSQK